MVEGEEELMRKTSEHPLSKMGIDTEKSYEREAAETETEEKGKE